MRTSPHTHPNDVYFNLHNSLWSVVARSTGRVAKHMNELIMLDVCFVVRPKGNAKVRSEKVKNVHAFVGHRRDPRSSRAGSRPVRGTVDADPLQPVRAHFLHGGDARRREARHHRVDRQDDF
jgi:hypothetical protein